MNSQALEAQYAIVSGQAERLRLALEEQIGKLLERHNITLGVPLESRVKLLASVLEKVERKAKELDDLRELDDLVGVRTILLFGRDVTEVGKLIEGTFDVLSRENTADRLDESQFGYRSQHYIIKLPTEWLSIPSLSDLGSLKAEVQVRTVAQHIWAAASHKLQYKQEQSVPPPVRRAIHRVSALLETIDLEFERVLVDREAYVASELDLGNSNERLNVDLIEALLNEVLPAPNKSENESYAELLVELTSLGIETASELRALLTKHLKATAAADAKQVERRQREGDFKGTRRERIERGVFFTHVGWTRNSLRKEFGEERFKEVRTNSRNSTRPNPLASQAPTTVKKPTL